MNESISKYNRLTPKMAWLLAAPHTWPASIFPVLLAISLTYANGFNVSISLSICLLLISVLLQSAVNAINDYFDYVKGTDSEDDNVEESDAILVYNNVNPKSARNLAIAFMFVALILGCYCVYASGWIPIVIAGIGAAVIFLYSGSKTPISYLPIGELVSGITMGCLITLASYYVLTRCLDPLVAIFSIPEVICIALIMQTNNTCDIEKDIQSSRKTLPVLIGRESSVRLYRALLVLTYVLIASFIGIRYTQGLLVIPFMLLASYPITLQLIKNPLLPSSRIAAMGQICSFNIVMGTFYCLALFASTLHLSF